MKFTYLPEQYQAIDLQFDCGLSDGVGRGREEVFGLKQLPSSLPFWPSGL